MHEFFAAHRQGRVLIGVCHEDAVFQVNGRVNFMDGPVREPSFDEIVAEIEKRNRAARALGFGDVAVLWPRQHIIEEPGGLGTKKTVGHRPLPLDKVAEACRRTKTYFWVIYADGHIEMNRTIVKRLQAKSGGRFLGECLGEIGGRTWYNATRMAAFRKMQQAAGFGRVLHNVDAHSMREAAANYVDYVRRRTRRWKRMGCPLQFPVDSTAMSKYNLAGGVDFAGVELCDRFAMTMATARGASKSYGNTFWCSYIPLGHYLGTPHNSPAKLARWRVALHLSYLMGASLVINENGVLSTQLYNLPRGEKSYGFRGSFCRKTSMIFQDFARFSATHRRPFGHPQAAIGVIQGAYDGWNGTTESARQRVWAQHGKGDHWQLGPAERSWKYLDDVYYPGGKWLSGSPYGQVDVVSSDAPAAVLKKYKLLSFMGWNTMTPELFSNLKKYVKSGGKLLLSLPHLNTKVSRKGPSRPVARALQKELLGLTVGRSAGTVRSIGKINDGLLPGMQTRYNVKGKVCVAGVTLHGAEPLAYAGSRPLLLRHTLGKGAACFLAAENYPGDYGLGDFYADLLKALSTQAVDDPELAVAGDPSLSWSVYAADGKRPQTLYVLEHNPLHDQYDHATPVTARQTRHARPRRKCRITIKGKTFTLPLKANEMRVVYVLDNVAISPSNKHACLKSYSATKTGWRITLSGNAETSVTVMPFDNAGINVTAKSHKLDLRRQKSNGAVTLNLNTDGSNRK